MNAQNWQPIETAPRKAWVLVAWADRPWWTPAVLLSHDDDVWSDEEGSKYRTPTHWMPLPAPPSSSGEAAR